MAATPGVELRCAIVTDELGHGTEVERTESDHIRTRQRRAFARTPRCDDQEALGATHCELQPLERARPREMDVLDDDHNRTIGGGALDDRRQVGEKRCLPHRGVDDCRRTTDVGGRLHSTEQWPEHLLGIADHGRGLVSRQLAKVGGEAVEHRLQRQLAAELVTPSRQHESCRPRREEPIGRAPRSCRCRLRPRGRLPPLSQP